MQRPGRRQGVLRWQLVTREYWVQGRVAQESWPRPSVEIFLRRSAVMVTTAAVHTRHGLSVGFLRSVGEEGIKDGIWCPLQLIEPFKEVQASASALRAWLKWPVAADYDPYDHHCILGIPRRRVAKLMACTKEVVDAIDVRATVVLLSPLALSELLSVVMRKLTGWQPATRFTSEDEFLRLEDVPAADALGMLVRVWKILLKSRRAWAVIDLRAGARSPTRWPPFLCVFECQHSMNALLLLGLGRHGCRRATAVRTS